MTDSPSRSRTDTPRAIPSGKRVSGRLRVPPSKSVSNRYLNLALLAGKPVRIDHPLDSEDIRLFIGVLRACGLRAELTSTAGATGSAAVPSLEIAPGPPRDAPGGAEIHCGASGTLFRFVVAALATRPGRWRVDGIPRLRERTVAPLVAALRQLGARIEYLEREGFAPLVIHGGSLGAGRCELDAGQSSQFLSALLMAALAAPGPVTVEVRSLTSEPYVDVTLQAIRAFGGTVERLAGDTDDAPIFRVRPGELRGGRHEVEGDFSAAAYPAAAALLTGGEVELEGLRRDSLQGDRRFLGLLERMGARVSWRDRAEEHNRESAGDRSGQLVTVAARGGPGSESELRSLEEDLSAIPDQVPTLAALAPFASGTTHITDVPHLRIKESDRLAAMATELRRAGVPVEEERDGLRIPGVWAGTAPPGEPVVLQSHGDHRIAMSCALVGLRRPGISIATPEVVAKSYPRYWEDLAALLGD